LLFWIEVTAVLRKVYKKTNSTVQGGTPMRLVAMNCSADDLKVNTVLEASFSVVVLAIGKLLQKESESLSRLPRSDRCPNSLMHAE
jgi:hypothetical protein